MTCSVKEISLGDDFGDVTVKVNGATIEVHVDGSVDAYPAGTVRVHGAANDHHEVTPSSSALKPGDRMPDGTVYAGVSPETGAAMYATPRDAPLTYTFNQARDYASKLDANGHKDWRVPTQDELNVLFNNRTAIGGFKETDASWVGWYRSSNEFTDHPNVAWMELFSGGIRGWGWSDVDLSLRCVRG